MVKLNGCIFLTEDDELLKNVLIFGIKSAISFKKNLITNQATMKNF